VYGAGERLATARLAKELGLSMTPVREALIELANEGLVEISPHRGARVAELGLVDLSDVYLARAILEPAATRLATKRLDANIIADVRNIHQYFIAAVHQSDADGMLHLNEKFHFAIYDLASSPLLSRLIRIVWSASPNDTFRLIPGRAEQSLKEHASILRALTSGSPERAEKAMQNHINESLQLITRFKKKRPRRAVAKL
jgi:DNA-binding GntR family transcriptional regulator